MRRSSSSLRFCRASFRWRRSAFSLRREIISASAMASLVVRRCCVFLMLLLLENAAAAASILMALPDFVSTRDRAIVRWARTLVARSDSKPPSTICRGGKSTLLCFELSLIEITANTAAATSKTKPPINSSFELQYPFCQLVLVPISSI